MRRQVRVSVQIFVLFCLLTTYAGFLSVRPAWAGTPVCGSITEDTTWDLAGSPYTLTCNVTVASGVTLTIEPGAEVQVNDPGYSIVVEGTLIADGTPTQPIRFRPTLPDTSGGGIDFLSSSQGSLLNHVIVERLGGDAYYHCLGALSIQSSATTVSNSVIRDSYEAGIYLSGASSPTIITNTLIQNSGGCGLRVQGGGAPFVQNCTIAGSGAQSICAQGSALRNMQANH